MEANELRIGNYLNQNIDNIPNHFIQFKVGEIVQGSEFLKTASPIPLTEEWLLKFGFDYIRNINEYHNRKINEGAYYLKPVGDVYDHWYLYHKTKMITSNIQHVHQLQNLYFVLTGEELTLIK